VLNVRRAAAVASGVAITLMASLALAAADSKPAPSTSNPLHACFSKKERKRLEKAGSLEQRVPEYARLADKRAEQWERRFLFGVRHWTQTWPYPGHSLDRRLEETNCLARAVIADLEGASVPLSQENDRSLGNLSRNLSRLATVLRQAEKNDSFFDHQQAALKAARWRVEDARAVVVSQFGKGAHVSLQGP